MAKSVNALFMGFDYQSRLFWLKVADLFLEHSSTCSVGFELDEMKSFDDVVVRYSSPIPEAGGLLKSKDYYQSKFHSYQTDPILHSVLIEPSYIGATKFSFLQKLSSARKIANEAKETHIYNLFTPSTIHPDDPIASIHSNHDHRLNVEKLFSTKTAASSYGTVRKLWCDHLEIVDEELKDLLGTLRIITGPSAKILLDIVDKELSRVGFAPIGDAKYSNTYDDLVRKLHVSGRNEFTKEDIIEIAKAEGLWTEPARPPAPRRTIGIRTFIKFAEEMPNRTEAMICLTHLFDGRHIRNQVDWTGEVLPAIEAFMQRFEGLEESFFVMLETHISIAFAAGHTINPKAPATFIPIQRNQFREPESWGISRNLTRRDGWKKDAVELDNAGSELAVAVGITHAVGTDVKDFVGRELRTVKLFVSFEVDPATGPTSIRDGDHAFQLANDLAAAVMQQVKTEGLSAVHIFAAAPVGFMFYLGRALHTPKGCSIHLYEYDFDSKGIGAYKRSLSFV